jgi:hypothetical protein
MTMLSSRYSGGPGVFGLLAVLSYKPMKDKILQLSLGLLLLVLEEPPVELRAAWINSEDLALLKSRTEVAAAMQTVADAGLNAVCPVVRAGADPAPREVLAEIVFEAHRLGLEVLPAFDPAGAAEDQVVKTVIDTCKRHDLDGVVGPKPFDRVRKEVAEFDRELVVVAEAGTEASEGEPAFRLPEKGAQGLIGLGKLLEKEGELARTLRDGPFAEDARLPWRKDRLRWVPSDPIEAFAGGGVWTWITPEDGPRFLSMDGRETGHATWTFEPASTGRYAVYAWIPSREDLAAHSSYRIASSGSARTVGIDNTNVKNRGWVFVAETHLLGGKPIEVARLDAEEKDATRITAAGPLMVLRSYRPKPR